MLQVQFFAKARELVGASPVEIPWPNGGTVSTLKANLTQLYPQLQPLIPKLLIAVNNDYANDDSPVQSSDEVACFPPVSGG
ncbi:MoaD/ThiS family protein [Schlesneria paludicola]|uniref:MoaD/ThiS family protein n=1 Tax=Schlesneria paludicola TaxID=360056 RepID=UPI00029A6A88|nr:MoaD/ThiS family protein [Schlesneria paludicola]